MESKTTRFSGVVAVASTSVLPAAATGILPCAWPLASVVTSVAGSGGGLGLAVSIFVGDQLQVYLGLHRFVIVVHRGYVKQRGVADAHGIAHRLHVDAEAAAGGEKASSPGDLAVSLIGDRGFDGVVLIPGMLQVGHVLRGHLMVSLPLASSLPVCSDCWAAS